MMRKALKVVALVAIVGGAIALGGGTAHQGSVCEINKDSAITAIEGTPAFTVFKSKIISSGSPTQSGRLCTVDVTLNNGNDSALYYYKFELRGQNMIYAGLGDEGLQLVKDHMDKHP